MHDDLGAHQGPGKTDPLKKQITPLPKLQLSVLLYLQLAEPITSTVILPFIVKLIEESGVTGGDVKKVGYYAGIVESLFFFTEALMILQWGRLSDRVGRRPVLLTGLIGLGLSMVCFGLSRTFWSIVASRALAGALNGNTGVIKCMMSEISDETNIDRAISFMPVVWAVGNTVGPLIGGLLQHPYERFRGIFHFSKFWEIHPYFLPCVTAALYSGSAYTLAFFLLQETVPSVIKRNSQSWDQMTQCRRHELHNNTASVTERSPLVAPKDKYIPLHTLLTSRVRRSILNYSLLALIDMAFVVLQPVFLSTPISDGGLGMSPFTIGLCLAGFGVANGVVSIFFFSPLNRRFGTKTVMMGTELFYVACFALFPVMNSVARNQGGLSVTVWVLLVLQLALATIPTMAFICVFLFLTSSAPTRSALGATTGLAQTTTSIMRSIGPAGATSLFALSVERNILGGGFVYVVLCTISVGATAATTLLPSVPWPREG